MYVINGIPEFRKNRYRNSDFRLERFSGFPICFSAGKFRNSELGSGIPNSGSPRKRNLKTEFPTKPQTPLRVLHKSISYIYKVFLHLDKL